MLLFNDQINSIIAISTTTIFVQFFLFHKNIPILPNDIIYDMVMLVISVMSMSLLIY